MRNTPTEDSFVRSVQRRIENTDKAYNNCVSVSVRAPSQSFAGGTHEARHRVTLDSVTLRGSFAKATGLNVEQVRGAVVDAFGGRGEQVYLEKISRELRKLAREEAQRRLGVADILASAATKAVNSEE